MNKIVIMNIVTLDSEGHLNEYMERYNSVEDAKKDAEDKISEWLEENHLTLDDQNEDWEYDHARRIDYDHLIEVHDTMSIAELDVYIKEFDIE